jgi:hypothetical protein
VKPSCSCGRCQRCRNRQFMFEIRAKNPKRWTRTKANRRARAKAASKARPSTIACARARLAARGIIVEAA